MARRRPTSPSATAARVVRVVEYLARESFAPKRLADIGADLDIPPPSLWRILDALQGAGWAQQDTASNTWTLGPGIGRIAAAFQASAAQRVRAIKTTYHTTTGEELPDE